MPPRSDGYIPPCIPTRAYKVPCGAGWVHEIKHDGYPTETATRLRPTILLPHEGVERVIQQLAEHHAYRAHRQSP
jgi:hypothetical protein